MDTFYGWLKREYGSFGNDIFRDDDGLYQPQVPIPMVNDGKTRKKRPSSASEKRPMGGSSASAELPDKGTERVGEPDAGTYSGGGNGAPGAHGNTV